MAPFVQHVEARPFPETRSETMADPQKKPEAEASTVASCSATDCVHNRNMDCHADQIVVHMQDGAPVCGTYSEEEPPARP